MNDVLIDREQARVLDILNQVKQLNKMITLHEKKSQDLVMAGQYRDMKGRFLAELKEILLDYEVEVLLKGQAA